jgi:hypothetical protein
VEPAASPSPGGPGIAPDPCSGYTCSGPGARLNVAYPYRLHTHCGVLGAPFDGRAFYVEAVDPATVTRGLDNPEDVGTMTLLSPHAAVFRASSGALIRFVDALPGVIGRPYPFRVYVLSGGNHLIDPPSPLLDSGRLRRLGHYARVERGVAWHAGALLADGSFLVPGFSRVVWIFVLC